MRPTYYPEELKAEAIKMVVERHLPASVVGSSMGKKVSFQQ
jgi:hypothetical protein